MINEQTRRFTQRSKIIHMLKEAGNEGCTNVEMSKVSLRYGGHIGELHRMGYKIKKMHLDGGVYRYFLLSEPGDIKYFSNAHDETLNDINENYDGWISTEQLENLLETKHFYIVRKPGWYEQQFVN